MEESLFLKWNNHTTSVLKTLSYIKIKEKFSDATIACQGVYFPVHRIILSMCSDYFDEIFDRIQSHNPVIVMKDIGHKEMEALLNYMYLGEVNTLQEELPKIISAAEALKIKGLAVSDNCSSKSKMKNDKFEGFVGRKSENHSFSIQHVEHIEEEVPEHEVYMNNQDLDGSVIGKCEAVINLSSHSHLNEENEINFENEKIFVESPDMSIVKMENDFEDCLEDQSSSILESALTKDNGLNVNERAMVTLSQDPLSQHPLSQPKDTKTKEKKKKSFKMKISLPSSSAKHKCAFCTYKSDKLSLVKRHTLSRHGKEKKYPCEVCGAKFAHKHNMMRHMVSHTGNYKFHCDYCGKKFVENYRLQKHLNNKVKCWELPAKAAA